MLPRIPVSGERVAAFEVMIIGTSARQLYAAYGAGQRRGGVVRLQARDTFFWVDTRMWYPNYHASEPRHGVMVKGPLQ